MVRLSKLALSLAISSSLALGGQDPSGKNERMPDFMLYMERCSTTLASQTDSSQELKTVPGDPVGSACERSGTKIGCLLVVPGGGKPAGQAIVHYEVLLDSPPLLHFADQERADFITVDTAAHTAVIISRLVTHGLLVQKYARASFLPVLRRNSSWASDECHPTCP